MSFGGGAAAAGQLVRPLRPLTLVASTYPKGRGLGSMANAAVSPEARPSGELARQRLRGFARFSHSAQQIHQTFGIDAPADAQTPYRAYSYGISVNKL